MDKRYECLYQTVMKNRGCWEIMGKILEQRGLNKDMDVMNIFQVNTLYFQEEDHEDFYFRMMPWREKFFQEQEKPYRDGQNYSTCAECKPDCLHSQSFERQRRLLQDYYLTSVTVESQDEKTIT